jgi:2TM domain
MNDSQNSVQGVETNDTDRALARKRIDKRRGLQGAFVAYVVINTFLVGVWAITGGGYFWPAWIIAGWGVGMLLGLWDYWRGPVTDADIDNELRRMRHGRASGHGGVP